MTKPIYAIGDIHGQLGKLQDALEKIERDGGPDAQIVFIGDYCDRGLQTRGVIDLLCDGLAAGRNWTCLLGNHDRMFSMFLEEYPRNDAQLLLGFHWFHKRIGGIETMASYGVEVGEADRVYQVHARARDAVPARHLAFLANLKHKHVAGPLLFVHAGIRPGVPVAAQSEDDLIWIRDVFLDETSAHPHLVVHGHSHIPEPRHYGNRINIDSGAAYGHALTAVVFEGRRCWTLTDDGRVSLEPRNGM